MSLTVLEAVTAVLDGRRPAITVAHAENLPRGDEERRLRNAGLALYSPPLAVWRSHFPGVRLRISDGAVVRRETWVTPAGEATRVVRTHVDRRVDCSLPYDASTMRREVEVEPWVKGPADCVVAANWAEAETFIADPVVVEHARYDYGTDALIAVRGPVLPLAAAYGLCGCDALLWAQLQREAPAALEGLVAALANRERRRLVAMTGCRGDVVWLGDDTELPPVAPSVAARYDLPVLAAAAQQCAAEGLRWGLRVPDVGAYARYLINTLDPPLLAVPSSAVIAGEVTAPVLWATLSREELLAGAEHAREQVERMRLAAGERGLVVDVGDGGLARCTNSAERRLLFDSVAAVLQMAGGAVAE